MELYKEILTHAIKQRGMTIKIGRFKRMNPDKVVETACYQTLKEIRNALNDEMLDDWWCLEKIDFLLSNIGLGNSTRHIVTQATPEPNVATPTPETDRQSDCRCR